MTAESKGRRPSNSSSHNSAGTETGDELEQDQSSLIGSTPSLKSGPIFINFSGSFTANQITIQIGNQNQTNIQSRGRSSSPNIYVGVTPSCFPSSPDGPESPPEGAEYQDLIDTGIIDNDTVSAVYMDMSGSSTSSQISHNSTASTSISDTSGNFVDTRSHRNSFGLDTRSGSQSRTRFQDIDTDGEICESPTLPIPSEYINGALDTIPGFRHDIKFDTQDDNAALRKVNTIILLLLSNRALYWFTAVESETVF